MLEAPPQQLFRQRVLDVALDRPAQRTRAELRLIPLRNQILLDLVGEMQFELPPQQALPQLGKFDVDDPHQILAVQTAEDDDVIHPVDELRLEELLGDAEQSLVVLPGLGERIPAEAERSHTAGDLFGPHIAGHDDDRVPEIDPAAERIGDPPLLQNLQQHVHHIRMRLLDLVEEHHRIGMATDLLGQLAPFAVPDVSRRRTDQSRDVELLHVLGHIHLNQRIGVAEHKLRQRLRQQRLAHAGRPEEDE